ncbi:MULTISPECIES: lipase family protein [unclassified Inquilinus]|uniref:lipase family protein n=1 Tax=unclassified Inquilinus TaxID=2645927 RepID=UPI003F8E786C
MTDLLTPKATTSATADAASISLLQLCQISYLAPSSIPGAFPLAWPLLGGGDWSLAWGPAQDPAEANLVYVATRNAPGPNGLTCLSLAVVVRGTDVNVSLQGLWDQIVEDLGADSQQAPPWTAPSDVLISSGTAAALTRIGGMSSGGQSLVDFLAGFYDTAANKQVPMQVTGHSLGGCVTTVVAPWLQAMLGQQGLSPAIVPYTYAGPTAGNQAFADAFHSAYPTARCYQNTLDVVPMAMARLAEIPGIYEDVGPGLLAPVSFAAAIFGYAWWLIDCGVSYADIPDSIQLPGTWLAPDGNDWLGPWADEAMQQHHTQTYMALLGGTSVTAVVAEQLPQATLGRRPRVNRTVASDPRYDARLGAAAAKLRRATAA